MHAITVLCSVSGYAALVELQRRKKMYQQNADRMCTLIFEDELFKEMHIEEALPEHCLESNGDLHQLEYSANQGAITVALPSPAPLP